MQAHDDDELVMMRIEYNEGADVVKEGRETGEKK